MYERFFGFRERPFELTLSARFRVLTPGHLEALSNLEYGIVGLRGITLLLGPAGVGKTTVIRAAIERQPARVHCVHVRNPSLTRAEFFELLAPQLGLSPEAGQSKAAFLMELEALLLRRRDAGETVVLVVDEAQSLPDELLEEIRLLANLETDDEKLLPVIVVGQPELGDRLNRKGLQQFKQRVALRCDLRPLTLADTGLYVSTRIGNVGGIASKVFTRDAVLLIHERASGIPRLINVIADNALLSGFAVAQRPVCREVVSEVCRDFDIGGSAAKGRMDRLVRHVMPSLAARPSVRSR